jgi:hypothetical protein
MASTGPREAVEQILKRLGHVSDARTLSAVYELLAQCGTCAQPVSVDDLNDLGDEFARGWKNDGEFALCCVVSTDRGRCCMVLLTRDEIQHILKAPTPGEPTVRHKLRTIPVACDTALMGAMFAVEIQPTTEAARQDPRLTAEQRQSDLVLTCMDAVVNIGGSATVLTGNGWPAVVAGDVGDAVAAFWHGDAQLRRLFPALGQESEGFPVQFPASHGPRVCCVAKRMVPRERRRELLSCPGGGPALELLFGVDGNIGIASAVAVRPGGARKPQTSISVFKGKPFPTIDLVHDAHGRIHTKYAGSLPQHCEHATGVRFVVVGGSASVDTHGGVVEYLVWDATYDDTTLVVSVEPLCARPTKRDGNHPRVIVDTIMSAAAVLAASAQSNQSFYQSQLATA